MPAPLPPALADFARATAGHAALVLVAVALASAFFGGAAQAMGLLPVLAAAITATTLARRIVA